LRKDKDYPPPQRNLRTKDEGLRTPRRFKLFEVVQEEASMGPKAQGRSDI